MSKVVNVKLHAVMLSGLHSVHFISDTVKFRLGLVPYTRIMVYNGHLITATLGSLDFFEIF